MLKHLTTLIWWMILSISYSPTLQADPIKPLSLIVTNPSETRGLSLIRLTLPVSAITEHANGEFKLWRWRIHADNDNLQQLYFADEDKLAKEFRVYGLLRKLQDCQLSFYYSSDGYHFEKPAFTVTVSLAQTQPPAPTPPKSGNNTIDRMVNLEHDEQILRNWAEARDRFFRYYEKYSPTIKVWRERSLGTYGAFVAREEERRWNRRSNGTLTTFSLFSGEAAIQETLQEQLLRGTENSTQAIETINELIGPNVPSHPFEKLLGRETGGELPIANLVPVDHYFVHLTHPRKILTWFEQISETGFQAAGLTQQSSYLDYALVDRYLRRFQLTTDLVKQLGNHIQQIAIFGPDLYLTDGSDLTIILDTSQSPLFKMILSPILGLVTEDSSDGVHQYVKSANHPAFFAQHEQWFILSTNRQEAAMALALAKKKCEHSLGQSAEFRYVLAHLPPESNSDGIFVYLSDPFIRQMVGPHIKIAQLRRDKAHARLYSVTAGSLLYQLDYGKVTDLDTLLKLGYVETTWLTSWEGDQITLDEQGKAYSTLYGELANMTSLSRIPIDQISEGERDAYQEYIGEYNSYWRTYFDPIGIRLTLSEPLKVETLILPLVENSSYKNVRRELCGIPDRELPDSPPPCKPVNIGLPPFTPQPVTTLSFKMVPQLVNSILGKEGADELVKLGGESVHLAFYDNHPLITLGSSDLMGTFAVGDSMFGLAVLGAIFTQPTALWIELKEANRTISLVEQQRFIYRLFGNWLREEKNSWVRIDKHLDVLESKDDYSWVFTLNIENILRFHLYLKQIDNYLVISNRPIHFTPSQKETRTPLADARLHLALDQIQQMQPSLHLHQVRYRQAAVKQHIGKLMPFLWLGAKTPEEAITRYAEIYGNKPATVKGSEWFWQPIAQRLENRLFGSLELPKLPDYTEGKIIAPTLFDSLKELDLNFRFEQEGVRIILYLTPRT